MDDPLDLIRDLFSQDCSIETVLHLVMAHFDLSEEEVFSFRKMRNNPNITIAELHTILGVSETAVEKNISFLKEKAWCN